MRFLMIAFLVLALFSPALATTSGDGAKGKELFESLTCVECHKNGGNSVKPSKPLKGDEFAKKYKDDGKLVKVIRTGVPGASMPGFGPEVIDDAQMKDLIAYLRTLTPSSKDQKDSGKKTGK